MRGRCTIAVSTTGSRGHQQSAGNYWQPGPPAICRQLVDGKMLKKETIKLKSKGPPPNIKANTPTAVLRHSLSESQSLHILMPVGDEKEKMIVPTTFTAMVKYVALAMRWLYSSRWE
mmetsp:Transcript_62264/g.111289  ORF Transcript_62264/g.111289 Transcript_62264/m.111289 type:complete len:117 (-) Transcript_62264:283-633(-)